MNVYFSKEEEAFVKEHPKGWLRELVQEKMGPVISQPAPEVTLQKTADFYRSYMGKNKRGLPV